MKTSEVSYAIYVDLDGVMADLEKFLFEYTGHKLTHDEKQDQDAWDKFHDLSLSGQPSYSVFDMMPDAQELWDYVKQYQPTILTATGPDYDYATKEKNKWVENNLDGYKSVITVPRSYLKSKYANHDSILIDDRMVSIGPWTKRGGIGILHTNAADSIARLQQLGL